MTRACMFGGLCLAVLLLAHPALAEFYKYRDSNGVLRFTDNLAEVPPDQRPDAESYKEADDYLTPYQKRARAEEARREAEMAARADKQDAFEDQQAQRMDLNKMRTELDETYGDLMREKKALQQAKAEADTPEKQAAYKKRVTALNKRIVEYEGLRNQYEVALKDFNEKTGSAQ